MTEANQDAIAATGCSKVLSKITLQDSHELRSILIDYHCILKCKAAMDQFLEGLNDGGISRNILKISALKSLFVHKETRITLGRLTDFFFTSNNCFS